MSRPWGAYEAGGRHGHDRGGQVIIPGDTPRTTTPKSPNHKSTYNMPIPTLIILYNWKRQNTTSLSETLWDWCNNNNQNNKMNHGDGLRRLRMSNRRLHCHPTMIAVQIRSQAAARSSFDGKGWPGRSAASAVSWRCHFFAAGPAVRV